MDSFDKVFLRNTNEAIATRDVYAIQDKAEEVFLFKPNICYDMIPKSIYMHMKNRLLNSLETNGLLLFSILRPDLDLESAVDYFIDIEDMRYQLTLKHKRTDVISAFGLKRFALTGKLSDHLNGLPPLSKEEVKSVLINLINRDRDPNDNYSLRITRQEIFSGDKSNGLFLTNCGDFFYTVDQSDDHVFTSLSFNHPALSDLFINYVNRWLTPRYVMSSQESREYITKLIKEIEPCVTTP
jgi:hypothetical protein